MEPLGILSGAAAEAAVEAGLAWPLAGGPLAFTLVRYRDEMPIPLSRAGDLTALTAPLPAWAGLPPGPAVMGIVNVTPDSFSDGGRYPTPAHAIAAAHEMAGAGAAIIDIGAESTRPGATPVAAEQEMADILPVLRPLAAAGLVCSIDTRNAATMHACLDAGANIINDVSGLRHDPAAAALLAARRCPVVLMHMRGTPATMTELTDYADLLPDIASELAATRDRALAAGIAAVDIVLDPGFGFAKTGVQNIELLRRLPVLACLGHPLLAGLSRKRFLGGASPADRLGASCAAAVLAVRHGARLIRTHDVAETVRALALLDAA